MDREQTSHMPERRRGDRRSRPVIRAATSDATVAPSQSEPAPEAQGEISRALVIVDGSERRQDRRSDPLKAARETSPDAGFLSQLLAMRAGMPSQRAKRRAAPQQGATAYESSEGLDRPTTFGRRLELKA
jgi:hypothetical protein